MTMTPDRFRELLDAGTTDAPPAPLPAQDLAAGRARLRRRRVALSATAAAVVVAGVVGAGTWLDGSDRAVEPITHLDVDAATAACQEQLPRTQLHGAAHVVTTAASTLDIEVVFVSETDRYWATCSVNLVQDQAPYVQPYDAEGTGDSGFSITTMPGCVDRHGCRQINVAMADRRDPAVAAVEVELAGGATSTVDSVDGFWAFSAAMRLPDGVTFDSETGLVVGMSGRALVHQVTFLDDAGEPIAASVFDGTGEGILQDRVPGLPSLDRYPSLTFTSP